MIDLIEVIKITDDLIKEFELKKVDKLYECYLKNLKIGYAVIYKRENNMLYLTIAEQYQNKGYGSIIFKLLLSKVNNYVICSVPFENVKMQRIIQNNKGYEVGRNGQEILYFIDQN